MTRELVIQPAVESVGSAEAINNRFEAKKADMSAVSHLREEMMARFVQKVIQSPRVSDDFFASIGSDEEVLRLVSELMVVESGKHNTDMIQALTKLEPYFDTVKLGHDMRHLIEQYSNPVLRV